MKAPTNIVLINIVITNIVLTANSVQLEVFLTFRTKKNWTFGETSNTWMNTIQFKYDCGKISLKPPNSTSYIALGITRLLHCTNRPCKVRIYLSLQFQSLSQICPPEKRVLNTPFYVIFFSCQADLLDRFVSLQLYVKMYVFTFTQPRCDQLCRTEKRSMQFWHVVFSELILTSDALSAHLSIECKCTAAQIETPICIRRTTTHQFIWQQQHTCGAVRGSAVEWGVDGQP